MLIAGLRREEIIRVGNEKYGWDVHNRQVDTYIARATKRLERESAVRRKAELGKALARFDRLYFRLYERKDYRGALQVQRELNDLLSLRSDRDDDQAAIDEWLKAVRGR